MFNKIKKLIKEALFFDIVETVIVGCEKEESDISQSISQEPIKKTKPINNKSNSDDYELSMSEIEALAENHNIKLAHIHKQGYSLSNLEAKKDSILASYNDDTFSAEELETWSNNFASIDQLSEFKDLFVYEYEKDYKEVINSIIQKSSSYLILESKIDSINQVILNDNREMFKTPILVFAETSKESFYYWAPTSIGGSGDGQDYLGNATERSAASADGMAAATGFHGLAVYGSWGDLDLQVLLLAVRP